jgi:GxxExxY protein
MIHHKNTKNTKIRTDFLSHEIIGAAIKVHRIPGSVLLESAYEECMCQELMHCPSNAKICVWTVVTNPDLVVDKLVIVEFKAVEKVEAIHEAQLLTYLRLTKLWLGLLINFSVRILKAVIKRLVNGYFVFFASLW